MTIMSLLGCGGNSDNSPSAPEEFNPFYRDHMRSLVGRMAAYARQVTADFIVIPQNGLQLLTLNGEPGGRLAGEYIAAIDGIGQEELFYGFDRDNEATPASVTDQWMPFLDRAEGAGTQVLVVDYCDSPARVDDSYLRNSSKGYISYAGPRELDRISAYPQIPHHMNVDDVTSLGRAQNLLYLLNPGNYDSRADFVAALAATNYDLVLVDAFFDRDDPLTAVDVALLGVKANGGRRLVLAYFSIGEAEDYRYYWRDVWDDDPPAWLAAENKDWRGNFKVRYWDPEWQAVLFGADDAYLDRILAAGFDGVYLDIIDAFDYFEQNGD
ncbi:MAG: endo alpha-1,4 polygalactosaminidase [bacterium]|nr:endo alpha-1,4 polygalactosaminidase [bacterium]